METTASGGWEGELGRWLAPFLAALSREAQRRWAVVYLEGLILPGERKSVEPLAARVAPGSAEQLHHLIGGSPWATGPDRKSTRPKSRHAKISYAVFCSKK